MLAPVDSSARVDPADSIELSLGWLSAGARSFVVAAWRDYLGSVLEELMALCGVQLPCEIRQHVSSFGAVLALHLR